MGAIQELTELLGWQDEDMQNRILSHARDYIARCEHPDKYELSDYEDHALEGESLIWSTGTRTCAVARQLMTLCQITDQVLPFIMAGKDFRIEFVYDAKGLSSRFAIFSEEEPMT